MKNSKAVTKGHSTITRLGILSSVTWMVVSFSAGSALAATDFQLWELKGDVSGEVVKPIAETSDKLRAVDLLVGKGLAKPDFSAYLREFKAQPTHFLEGIREALVSLKGDKTKVEAFKKFINEGIDKADSSNFGGPEGEVAIKKLVEELFKLDPTKLADMSAEELVAALFSDETPEFLKTLALTSKKSEEKKDDKSDEEEVASTNLPVGEINTDNSAALAEAEANAQQVCDRLGAAKQDQEDRAKAFIEEMRQQLAAATRFPVVEEARQDQNANLANDVLKALKEEQQPVVPPQSQLPIAQTPVAPQEENDNPSVLDQGVPPPQEQQQQFPFMAPQQTAEYRLPNLPIDAPKSPSRERKAAETATTDAEAVLAETENVASQTTYMGIPLNPYQLAGKFGAALGKVGGVLEQAKAAEQTAKNRFDKLDEQWALVKSPSDLLSDTLKTERTNIEAEIKRAENAQADQTQQLQMQMQQVQDPQQQAYLAQQMGQLSQGVRAAKSKLEQFDSQYAQQVAVAKKAMDAGKAELAKLEDAWTALKGKRAALDGRKKELEAAIEANAQQAMSSQTAGQGGYNILNRLQSGGATNRATTPRGIGAAVGRGRI